MNNAGLAVFEQIHYGPVGVVCGKGNNGGDGFVVARLALVAGMDVQVVLAASRDEVRGDALTFLRAYENLGGTLIAAPEADDAAELVAGMRHRAVLVDALLGTGLTGEVRGTARAVIEAWPDTATIAVDTPSGLDTDRGIPRGCCVRASRTVTFQCAKLGFAEASAQPYTGEVIVADIGIPPCCFDDAAWQRLREG